MEENYVEDGLSLGELFRVIFRRGWLVLVITVAVTIVGALAVALIINPMQTQYSMTFSYNYPNSSSQRYPDGTSFVYRDIVSQSSLETAKASDEAFAGVDIEGMYEDDGISITALTETDADGVTVETGEYTMNVGGSYFDSSQQATQFLRTLANGPINYINSVVGNIDYAVNLTAYETSNDYETRIDYLSAQRNYLLGRYDDLIAIYGDDYVVTVNNDSGDPDSLSALRSQVNRCFRTEDETDLRNDLTINGYVMDKPEYIARARVQLYTLTREKRENAATIAALEQELQTLVGIYGDTAMTQYETFNEQIVNLTVRNAQIDSERQQYINNLNIIQNLINTLDNNGALADDVNKNLTVTISDDGRGNETVNWPKDASGNDITDYDYLANAYTDAEEDFSNDLNDFFLALENITNTFKSVNISLYESESTVIFNTNNVVASGGINIIIAGVVSLIIGFVIACIVVSIMDLPAYLREKKRRAANAVAGGKEPPEAKEAKDDKPDNE